MNTINEIIDIKREVRERTAGYIVAALGFVAGLAWNEAIKALIESFFPQGNANSVLAKFIYAILVTIVVVLVTVYLGKLFRKETTDTRDDNES